VFRLCDIAIAVNLILVVLGCAGRASDRPVDGRTAAEYTKRLHTFMSTHWQSRNCAQSSEQGETIESLRCSDPSIAEFAAAIPRIAPQSEIIRQGGAVGPAPDPSHQWYEFTPEVVGDHLVVAKRVECHCACDRMHCSYSESGGVYDKDPKEYFALGPGVRRDEAFEVVSLYRAGKIEPTDWSKEWDDLRNMRIAGVVNRPHNGLHALVLSLSSEACGVDLHVRIEGGMGIPRHLVVLEPVEGGCV
jgi:hypothetical protein